MTTPTLLPDIDSESNEFTLVRAMDDALDAVVGVYETAGVALPQRKYWTLSNTAADSEQLTISLIQAYHGVPNEQIPGPTRCDGPRTFTMYIQILRCIPVLDDDALAPTGAQIQQASARQAVDMWLLLDAVPDITGGAPAVATVDAGAAQGGFQGVTLTVTQQVM
jgi:hypothetical protein